MKYLSLILLVTLILARPSVAETPANPFENQDGSPSGLPRPEAKPDFLLQMGRKDCERLLRRADQPGVTYTPGVDVRGNRVVGANLAGTLTAADILPEEIAFELTLNPITYAGNDDLAAAFADTTTSLGTIRYNLASGALTLDGKKLNGDTEQGMITLCRQALGR